MLPSNTITRRREISTMHELTIAESIKSQALDLVHEEGYESPSRLEVAAGSGYSPEKVEDALAALLPDCSITVEEERCPTCGEVPGGPVCGCGTEIGKGCRITSLEAEPEKE